MLLHVAPVFIRGRRWRRRRRQVVVPLLRARNVGLHEGVGGAGAGAERSEAAQVAGRPREPHLGSLRRSHHAAGVELGLRQPRRDLHRRHGVHVQLRHEGRVLNSSCMKERHLFLLLYTSTPLYTAIVCRFCIIFYIK